jgi:hypothetical protein
MANSASAARLLQKISASIPAQRNRLAISLPFLPRLSRLIFHDRLDPTSVGVPFLSGDGGFPSACQVRQA